MTKPRLFSAEQLMKSAQTGCMNCKWYRQEEKEDWGECWLMPPVPVVCEDEDGNATQGNVRPQVDGTDLCSKWEPSQ